MMLNTIILAYWVAVSDEKKSLNSCEVRLGKKLIINDTGTI
jgi:hypothetical protein